MDSEYSAMKVDSFEQHQSDVQSDSDKLKKKKLSLMSWKGSLKKTCRSLLQRKKKKRQRDRRGRKEREEREGREEEGEGKRGEEKGEGKERGEE